MSKDLPVVSMFTIPLQFPCGPGTTCCSVGQSEDDVKAMVSAIERLGVRVKVYDVELNSLELDSRFPSAGDMLKEFGPGITPILCLNDEVIAMGVSTPEIAESVIGEKLNLM